MAHDEGEEWTTPTHVNRYGVMDVLIRPTVHGLARGELLTLLYSKYSTSVLMEEVERGLCAPWLNLQYIPRLKK
jgi:hypothetical protein